MSKYWRYENLAFTLTPVDASNPRLGGKVEAKGLVFDLRTLTPAFKTYYGVYSDDFLTFAELKQGENALQDEEGLTRIVSEPVGGNVLEKTTFKFENNHLSIAKDVSEELDADIHHSLEETTLKHEIEQSWTEVLFYGIGNAKV